MTVGILILVIVLVFVVIPIAGGIWTFKKSDWLGFWDGLLVTLAVALLAALAVTLRAAYLLCCLAIYGIVSLWTMPL